jgi:URI fold toxin 2
MPHGNSHKNKNPYHLYAIDDTLEKELFKYGITDDPLETDGLPARLRKQLNLFNLVANFIRFVGRIIKSDIPGRAAAEKMEDEFIDQYEQEHGRRPRGNPPRNKK